VDEEGQFLGALLKPSSLRLVLGVEGLGADLIEAEPSATVAGDEVLWQERLSVIRPISTQASLTRRRPD
jgi:hypothetical protein